MEADLGGGDYLLAIVLGVAYVFLSSYLGSYTLTWGDSSAWYEVWGRSAASAVAWMQLLHSVGVVMAATPVGLVIARRYRSNWFAPASIAGIVACYCVFLDQLTGIWLLADLDIRPGLPRVLSMGIDTTKVGFIVVLVTALLRRVMRLAGART